MKRSLNLGIYDRYNDFSIENISKLLVMILTSQVTKYLTIQAFVIGSTKVHNKGDVYAGNGPIVLPFLFPCTELFVPALPKLSRL